MEQQLVIQIMGPKQGHKDRKYNPNDPEEVRKIKKFIMDKVKKGWMLLGMKAGDKDMHQIKPEDIDDPELDRFILAGHEQVEKKALMAPNAGG